MSKDLMGDMVGRRKELLSDGMTVVEWFDPSKTDHMEAFKVLKKSGQWPKGFILEGLEFPGTWVVQLNEKVLKHLMEGKVPLDSDAEDKKIKQLVEAPQDRIPTEEPDTEEPEPKREDDKSIVSVEKEPTADVDLEKIYLGQSGDTHFYVVSDKNEAGMTEDLQVIDQEGNVVVSAKEEGLDIGDVSAFILGAIQNEALQGAQLERSVVMQYLVPRIEAELEEPEEEFGQEPGAGEEEPAPGEEEEGTPPEATPRESRIWKARVPKFAAPADVQTYKAEESKEVLGMLIEDAKGNKFNVEVVDEGTTGETIVSINGREFRFQEPMVKVFADNGKLTDESIKELVLQTLSHLDEFDYAELVGQGIHEDVDVRGQQDGTGPYSGSARAQMGEPGMRKAAGKPCPMSKDGIPGGKTETSGPITVEPFEIQLGMDHEMEHTDDPKVALEIALDHLVENPKYYSELETKMDVDGDDTEGEAPAEEEEYEECRMRPATREAKKNPKAKVRNRGTVVFPAESSSVTDDKDHFPINDENQAWNALARVNQYSKAPKWYKGKLSTMKSKVASAVRRKYPSIKVTKASTEGKVPQDSDPEDKKIQQLKENTKLNEFLGDELEQRNDVLFKELVPPSGPADTLEGEMLRAMNRLVYRYFNDGEYFDRGYGILTAGPAHSFLSSVSGNVPGLQKALDKLYNTRDEAYEEGLKDVANSVLNYIESRNGKYTKNTEDMLDYEPEFEYEEEAEYESCGSTSPVTEGVLELVGEIDLPPDDVNAVRKAIEDGRIDNEWPSDKEMIDALSGLEDVVDPMTAGEEPDVVRTAYLRYIIVPKAISTADVEKEGMKEFKDRGPDMAKALMRNLRHRIKKGEEISTDEQNLLAELEKVYGSLEEGEYSDMAGASSFKKVFQVDYVTDSGEEKSTRVMAYDEREAGEMLTRQKGVKSVVKTELVKEAADGNVEEGQDPDKKVDQDITDLDVEPEDEKEEADESTEDELTDDEARALRTAESLLGLQSEPLKMDEVAVGDVVQIVKRTNFEMVVEEATIKQMDEERGVEITGNTIPEKQQWFGSKHYIVIKL